MLSPVGIYCNRGELSKFLQVHLHELLELAYILEESIQTTLYSGLFPSYHSHITGTAEFEPLISFYKAKEIHRKQVKFSSSSLSKQLHSLALPLHNRVDYKNTILQSLFEDPCKDSNMMPEEQPDHNTNSSTGLPPTIPTQTSYWVNNTSVSTLSTLILEQLKKNLKNPDETGNKTAAYQPILQQDIHNEL